MSEPRVVRVELFPDELQDLLENAEATVEADEKEVITILSHHDQGVGPLEGWMRGWSRERIRPPWAHENIGAAELNDMVADAISEILGEDHED